MVRLLLAVLVVGAAEQRDVAVDDCRGGMIGVGQQRTIGMVCQKKAALLVQALERGVRVDPEPRDQRRAVHHEMNPAGFLGPVQDLLERGGVVSAAARDDVAVELGPGLAGRDSFRVHG